MNTKLRIVIVTVAAVAALAYTLSASGMQSNGEIHIAIKFWGLLAFMAVLIAGPLWVRGGGPGSRS